MFRPAMDAWRRDGVAYHVVARDKDITSRLLERYGIPFTTLAPVGRGLIGQFCELARREIGMFRLARRLRPKIITGTSVNAARVARLVGARSVILCEDDAKYIPLFRWLAYPMASAIITPDALAYENRGERHLTYPSYQKLFYLHPNRFTPDAGVLKELGLREGEPFGLVRLSALQAHHDIGARGMSEALIRNVISLAQSFGVRLFISSEKPLAAEFAAHRAAAAPERMHDALAHAAFLVCDSQSMTVESALLGTPAFKINTFAGIISVIRELEQAGLAFGYRPGNEAALLSDLRGVLSMPDRRAAFAGRLAELLRRKVDPLPWFLGVIERLMNGETLSAVQTWSKLHIADALSPRA